MFGETLTIPQRMQQSMLQQKGVKIQRKVLQRTVVSEKQCTPHHVMMSLFTFKSQKILVTAHNGKHHYHV